MSSTVLRKRPSPEILARHGDIAELVELERLAGNWSTQTREARVIPVPVADCTTDDTCVVVIGRADDADLLALRDAAVAQDKDGIGRAYLRFGSRVDAAAGRASEIELANAIGVADLTYAGRTILRSVIVDHVVGFNMFGFAYAGGRLDASAFHLVEQRIREDAAPLAAVLLVKERPLSPLEEEAERVAPGSARTAVILPRIVGDFIDDIVDKMKGAAENVADTAKKVVHVAGCQIRIDVANPNAVATREQDAQQRVEQNVAQRTAMVAAEDFGPLGARASYVVGAPSPIDLKPHATIDDLIDYRARVFRRS